MTNSYPSVYLASSSPRRSELLGLLNVDFQTLAIDVPEIVQENEKPEDYVIRLAIAKATYGLGLTDGKRPIIGADTIGVLKDKILEKPKNSEDAIRMLLDLSGQKHYVYTGLCILNSTKKISELVVTEVTFRTLSLAEIEQYVATGDPLDKAGSYGIQGPAGAFVHSISGNYHNVVGLPLSHLSLHLNKFL